MKNTILHVALIMIFIVLNSNAQEKKQFDIEVTYIISNKNDAIIVNVGVRKHYLRSGVIRLNDSILCLKTFNITHRDLQCTGFHKEGNNYRYHFEIVIKADKTLILQSDSMTVNFEDIHLLKSEEISIKLEH